MTTATKTKRTTLATFKAFLRRNDGRVEIRNLSRFDGMTDGVEQSKDREFRPLTSEVQSRQCDSNLGLNGVWLVGSGRNYFKPFNDGVHTGINVSNCCGSFDVAVRSS